MVERAGVEDMEGPVPTPVSCVVMVVEEEEGLGGFKAEAEVEEGGVGPEAVDTVL